MAVVAEGVRELWNEPPLEGHRTSWLDASTQGKESIIRSIGPCKFAPSVCTNHSLVADLRITLLRPEPPGRIVAQAGDIHNRLKTLLDALTMPHQPNALPPGAAPSEDESPFFCLLEDDNLITRLDVSSDRLLDPTEHPSVVVLLINFRTRPTAFNVANLSLA